jgi:glutathione S-transferase
MPLIFHATALSSYSAKVRIVLCTKGVVFEERSPPQGYRSAAYRAIVPMGTLPAIQDGDWVLSESEAIAEYLEECHPQPPMLPPDPRGRAQVRFLARFHDLYLEPLVRALFGQVRPAARDDRVVAQRRAEIAARLEQLASFVRPQPYLLTPRISLADCGPLVSLPLATWILQACGQPLVLPPVLHDWLETASQAPAVERALAPWRAATRQWIDS